ncbi:MAG: glycosyltransferase family 9 protein [Candidatus Obscuribacterales bacterium]|nr:glycosyltransferase family 9 protein [Candidatus Obscuribacterales bacterium]
MKMLAVNFGGLGDEVLFLPTLKSIKLEHPDWNVTLLTEPRARSIKQLTDTIDEIITFDIKKRPLLPQDYIELISLLRRGGYDLILSSGSSMQVSVLLFLSGIKRRVGYDSGALSHLLLTSPVKLNRNQYAGLMYHDLVTGLNLDQKPKDPEITLSADSLSKMRALLEKESNATSTTSGTTTSKRIILHPGTSKLAIQKGIFKVWAAANWCELIERLMQQGHEVILAGGPEDEDAVKDILAGLAESQTVARQPGRFWSACGKTANVADLAALIHLCDLMICVDSAPMHIAAGVNAPLVALFGPTDPAKLLPTSPRFVAVVEDKALAATRTASGVQIPVDTVYRTAVDLLTRVSSRDSSPEFHSR